ncbi:hypothetical protein HY086_02525 [Candidatus Gottesmanbacteria bacterium]|nr:hypothetical protein [Candidatus Gottesmanbacteria bacterium]
MNDPFGQQPSQKKPVRTPVNDSILESLRSLGGGVGKTVTKDVVGKGASDALRSLFGSLPAQQPQGEFRPNQPIDFSKERFNPYQMRRPEVIVRPQVKREEVGMKEKIDAVRVELKALAQSVKQLRSEITNQVDQTPIDPGIYHLNFFERLRGILKILRQQIEDSRSWLLLWTGRKKKMGYWGRYKKHGTQFGLSSERTVATQAG